MTKLNKTEKMLKEHLTKTLNRVFSEKSTKELSECHWFNWDGPDGSSSGMKKKKAA
ncbi:hypothetical protein [Aliikangiella marina]|uniref:hypothetical protein n=1 Tax=Aliikangiella marina TaxID=1712262 RepID=UPI00163D9040|nr:hypothetical protein [Aliikangiella marina]